MYIKNFNDIPRSFSYRFRNLCRLFILDILSIGIKIRYKNLLKTPRVQLVYIHHIFEDEIKIFDNIIIELKKLYNIIPLSEAIDRIHNNKIDKPYLAFSSDDGFKSNLNAHKVFEKHDIKACFFLCSDFIGLEKYDIINDICKEKFHLPPIEFLNYEDVKVLISCGHEIGSHTTNHSNLNMLDFTELNSVITDSYKTLSKLFGLVKHFSFPYGTKKHFPKQARKIVSDAGFTSCISAIRGCHLKQNIQINKNEILIKRDILDVNYNINHILYFMINNIKHEQRN